MGKAFNLKPSVIMRRVQRGWSEREVGWMTTTEKSLKNGDKENILEETQTIDGKLYPKPQLVTTKFMPLQMK